MIVTTAESSPITWNLHNQPDEIIFSIIRFLPFEALKNFTFSCSRFRNLISNIPANLARVMLNARDPRIALLAAKHITKSPDLVEAFLSLTGMAEWEMENWDWDALLPASGFTPNDLGGISVDARSLDLDHLYTRLKFFAYLVKNFSSLHSHLPPNRALILAIIKQIPLIALEILDPTLRTDVEIMTAAVSIAPISLNYGDASIQDNEEVVKLAISIDPTAIRYASDRLRKLFLSDRAFVLSLVKAQGSALETVDPVFQDDEAIVEAALLQSPLALLHASDRLQDKYKKDRNWVLKLVKIDGWFLRLDDPAFKKDRDIVLAAVSQNFAVFQIVGPPFNADEEIVLAAIRQDAYSLFFAHFSLQDDDAFIKKATSIDPTAIEYASDRLQKLYLKNKAFVLKLLEKNGFFFETIDPSLQDDEDVVEAVLLLAPELIAFASSRLQAKYRRHRS